MSKKPTIQVHICFQCRNAYLMRSAPHNPIVSECVITHVREVASTPFKCFYFKQRMDDAEIHPMIPCK